MYPSKEPVSVDFDEKGGRLKYGNNQPFPSLSVVDANAGNITLLHLLNNDSLKHD